jgi:bile acid:Na+ symporter, BASS family
LLIISFVIQFRQGYTESLIVRMGAFNLSDYMVTITLFIIMLGIGMSLTAGDFKNIFLHPKALTTALVVQLFIIPLLAFVIAFISPLTAAEKVGLVIVSACASGASSNLITHLFKGNVALAISMTTINSIITVFWVPFVVGIALPVFMGRSAEIHLPFLETVLEIFIIVLLPATLGMLFRAWKPGISQKLEKPLKFILPLILAAVFSIKLFGGQKVGGAGMDFSTMILLLPFCLLLNIGAMFAGWHSARTLKLNFQVQYTIAIEVSVHNTTLALLIAGTLLKIPGMENPAIVYAMFSFFTAVLFVYLLKRRVRINS